MASVQNLSLKEIAALCNTLGLLVDRLMEPNSLAMVVGMTSNVIFTKLTSKVLSEIELQHPLQKIICNAVSQYTLETGGDSKIFVMLFKEIIIGIKDMLDNSDEIEVRQTIIKQISFLKSFIPDIFKNILNTYAHISLVNFCSSKELEGIILTFFHSKFSANISKKLSSLVCYFVSHSISNSSQALDALDYLISNFNVFCTKVIAPLSESVILEGFLLHERLSPLLKHSKKVYFVVILNFSCKSDDAIWEANNETFSQKLENLWDSVKNPLKQLRKFGILLILTENGVSSNCESLCSQNDITIISRMSKEDISSVLHLVNISPMNNLHDSVESQNIGCLESLTSHVVGGTSFAHLRASVKNHAYLVPHHILLCSPLEEVLKDYYSECLNCLKAVKQWLQPINIELFHKENMSKDLKIQKYLDSDCDQLLNYSEFNNDMVSKSCILGVAFPFGLFEFALKNILIHFYGEKLLPAKKLCDILDYALLTVIHKLYNTPKRIAVDEKDYLEFHKRMKCRIAVPIEPSSSKENLLIRVLQLVEQIIKIDAVLSIR